MRESAIETKVVRYAEGLGVIVLKLSVPSSAGWPDRLFLLKGGKCFFIEFKSNAGRPSRLQRYRQTQLRVQGHASYICNSTINGKEIVDAEMAAS